MMSSPRNRFWMMCFPRNRFWMSSLRNCFGMMSSPGNRFLDDVFSTKTVFLNSSSIMHHQSSIINTFKLRIIIFYVIFSSRSAGLPTVFGTHAVYIRTNLPFILGLAFATIDFLLYLPSWRINFRRFRLK